MVIPLSEEYIKARHGSVQNGKHYLLTCLSIQVPLPPIPEGLERDLLEDMENQVDLSTTALPSAIFYTFVNTHRSLNCVNFTCDGSMLAGRLRLLLCVIVSGNKRCSRAITEA